MATNYVQEGCFVTVAAPTGGTTSGNAYLITGIFGVASTTQLVGVDVELATEGVWTLTKVGSQAWSVGDRIYWDDANSRCSSDAGAGIYIGVCTAAVASGAGDTTGNVRLNGLTPALNNGVVNVTAATLTVTAAKHAGKVVTLNKADGIAVTLPAASGTGNTYKFFVGTTVSSVGTTIKVVGNDTMVGSAINAADGGATAAMFEASGTDDTITMDGSTTGGIKGDFVELIDVAADLWSVRVTGSATGSEATPFSATVS
jgi:predicted RecA/RadA family phage recombinase